MDIFEFTGKVLFEDTPNLLFDKIPGVLFDELPEKGESILDNISIDKYKAIAIKIILVAIFMLITFIQSFY